MTQPFLAEIRIFAGNFAPRGNAFCSGQLLQIGQNSALFSILGTTYGGDGQSTFALPDLRGRVPIHFGQGPGLSPYTIGQSAGTDTVSLTANQVPAHTHTVQAVSNTVGDQVGPPNNLWARAGALRGEKLYASAQGTATPMNATAIGGAGGSQPHNNMPPYLALSFIIALQGIFPSRN